MKPRKIRSRWLMILLALGVVACGGAFLQARRVKGTPVDPALLVTVARRPLAVDILDVGRIQAREKVEVKSKIAGQVTEVRVREGMRVKKGDVLVVLDPTDSFRELSRAQAGVAMARQELAYARTLLGRAERGAKEGVVSQADLDQATHNVAAKQVSVRAAEVTQSVADDRVHYTKILSPMDGTVIVRGIEPGEAVVAGVQSTFDGKSLITVADLSALVVKVNLNQIDVARTDLGRKATLTLDALPGHTYEAVVTKIAPASIKLPGKEHEIFPVEAVLAAPDDLVKPGMTADVRIHLDAKDGVIAIPLETVTKESGQSYVTRVVEPASGKNEKILVSLGIRNDRDVEVTGGLAEGDRILLKPPSAADNETKL